MRRFHIVDEPGYGAQWLFVATEPGPGVEPVAFVSNAGYGSIPGYIVSEYGPGAKMVYPTEGAHLAGGWTPAAPPRSAVQQEPDFDALTIEERLVLMRVDMLRDAAAGSGWTEPDVLTDLLDLGLAEIGRQFSSGPWDEHVMLCTALAAMSLRRNGADPQSLIVAFVALSSELERRGWTGGSPSGILPEDAAREVMTTGPHLQRLIEQDTAEPREIEIAAPTVKKKRFWQR